MGLIAKILTFAENILIGDTGNGYNVTTDHATSPGVDSAPLPDDDAVLVPLPGTGNYIAIAFGVFDGDGVRQTVVNPGETRLYSRDGARTVVAELYLKNDGTIEFKNDNASVNLTSGGDIAGSCANASISASGNVEITAGGSLTASASGPIEFTCASFIVNGKQLDIHTHLAGTPPGTTGPNL